MTSYSISMGAAGMQRASHQLELSAGRIARLGVEGQHVEIAAEMVNIIRAEHDFKATTRVAGIAADMSKSLLDILV